MLLWWATIVVASLNNPQIVPAAVAVVRKACLAMLTWGTERCHMGLFLNLTRMSDADVFDMEVCPLILPLPFSLLSMTWFFETFKFKEVPICLYYIFVKLCDAFVLPFCRLIKITIFQNHSPTLRDNSKQQASRMLLDLSTCTES